MIESSNVSFTDSNIEYFKKHIFDSYNDNNISIKKNIPNLINIFVKNGGLDIWPEILTFILKTIDNKQFSEISLETLNFLIEDSGFFLEERFVEVCYFFNFFYF